jgi:hypothetical protein
VSGPLEDLLARIDAENAADPVSLTLRGRTGPRAVVHAEEMTRWLGVLDPGASDAQQLAARAHHFRRWIYPRSEYPQGRAGYLKWRAAANKAQAAAVVDLLADNGVAPDIIERTDLILRKVGRESDPQVQTHEDCLCLVFFDLQAGEVAAALGSKADDVVQKTLAKMSPAARELVATLPSMRE